MALIPENALERIALASGRLLTMPNMLMLIGEKTDPGPKG
jgi:hypothetical protein